MSNTRGFTLVETVVAIGLVTGALMALAQLVATSVHTTAAARYRTLATLVAQQKIEHLRSEATLADGAAVQHFDESGVVACATAEVCAAAVLTARWSVSAFAPAPATVLIDVEVTHAHRNYGAVRSLAIRPRSLR
jgi:Tfp pilus assembly protein PilV